MKHLLLFTFSFLLLANAFAPAQEVFYHETFNWRDDSDPKGWKAPEGFYMEDPNDTGFNWHWWSNDSLVSSWIAEPPFQSTSRDDGHLCLFAALYNDYRERPDCGPVNNSIVFPVIDCSTHSSVILQFETNFKNSGIQGSLAVPGNWVCLVEVSGDGGYHWTQFNAGFDIPGSGRPNDIAPGEVALFRENISEVAAGSPYVMIRITWYNYFGLYFWIIDDLQLSEARPNDLRLNYIDLQWKNNIEGTNESVSYMMPLSQLGKGQAFHLFNSGVTNMGATEATNLVFDVTIKHEEEIVFSEAKTIPSLKPGYIDTLFLDGEYEPAEKGSYSIQFNWKQDQEDDFPEDNERTIYFQVSDSVYNRAGDQPDYTFSSGAIKYMRDEWSLHANVNHFMGSVFPIYGDCEIDGISAYIMGGLADGLIDFEFTVWQADYYQLGEHIDPRLLLRTENLYLDSSMFNTWVYMPFNKNGEDEFIKAGSLLWTGIEYSNWHPDEAVRRDKGLGVGGTKDLPYHDARAMGAYPTYNGQSSGYGWSFIATKNLMIRLYLHEHSSSTNPDILEGNSFALGQNFPNPFTDQTVINYTLGRDESVKLEITNLTGQVVFSKDEGIQHVGHHQIQIQNPGLSPGIYFYTLYAGQNKQTRKMIVMEN